MKRFDFRLQKAMEWRELQVEREKAELDRLHRDRQEVADSLQMAQDERQSLAQAAVEQQSTTAEELHRVGLFSQSLFNLERKLTSEEQDYSEKIQVQQQAYFRADRDHRLVVQLRDNQLKSWNYELNRENEQVAAESWNSRRSRESATESAE